MPELQIVGGKGVAPSTKLASTKILLAELKEENQLLREQLANVVLDLASLIKEQTPSKLKICAFRNDAKPTSTVTKRLSAL